MDGVSLPFATIVIQILGLPGLVFVIWYFDMKRDQKKEELRKEEIAEREKAVSLILAQYKDDVGEIKHLYKNNAHLVEDYSESCSRLEHLYSETLGVISLNTQTQTHLVDAIKNNNFCPVLRKEGPNG
jgi:hypothetical protein